MMNVRIKKLSYLCAIVATLVGNTVSAAEPAYLSAADIQKQFKKFKRPSVLTAQFDQVKSIKDLDVQIKTSGHLKIKKRSADDVAILWLIDKPESMKVCITEDQIIFDNTSLKKKTVLKLSEISNQDSSGLSKLIHLIKLDPDEIITNFNIEMKDKSSGHAVIYPKKANQYSFIKAEVDLDKNKNLKVIELVEANEDTLKINFTKIQESPGPASKASDKECN